MSRAAESPNQPLRYPGVGHCIYCGVTSSEAKLTDEHVIAYGLGGNLVLPDASCLACAKETSRVERHCLHGMLGNARIRLGLPTRRRHQRPDTIEVKMKAAGEPTIGVPVSDFPVMIMMPKLAPPGILFGREPSSAFQMDGGWAHRFDLDTMDQIRRIGIGGLPILQFEPWKFGLMLAKIGHAAAVAACGAGNFTPYLPDIILGKSSLAPHFIGSTTATPAEVDGSLHEITVSLASFPSGQFIVTFIRLFAFLGAPTYAVVAGKPIESGGRQHLLVPWRSGTSAPL